MQVRVLAFQCEQFLHQLIIFRVGDERIVQLMIAAVVKLDVPAELGSTLPDRLRCGHGQLSMGCFRRFRMCAILLALSGWRDSSH